MSYIVLPVVDIFNLKAEYIHWSRMFRFVVIGRSDNSQMVLTRDNLYGSLSNVLNVKKDKDVDGSIILHPIQYVSYNSWVLRDGLFSGCNSILLANRRNRDGNTLEILFLVNDKFMSFKEKLSDNNFIYPCMINHNGVLYPYIANENNQKGITLNFNGKTWWQKGSRNSIMRYLL